MEPTWKTKRLFPGQKFWWANANKKSRKGTTDLLLLKQYQHFIFSVLNKLYLVKCLLIWKNSRCINYIRFRFFSPSWWKIKNFNLSASGWTAPAPLGIDWRRGQRSTSPFQGERTVAMFIMPVLGWQYNKTYTSMSRSKSPCQGDGTVVMAIYQWPCRQTRGHSPLINVVHQYV